MATTTQVTLRLEYEPEGAVEKTGDVLKIVDMRTKGDLERFKAFLETRSIEHRGTAAPRPARGAAR